MPVIEIVSKASKSKTQVDVLESGWYLLALVPIGLELFLSVHGLKDSWDDGAITAAFSQTWAHTGKIALTPGSAVVEGFSSILWFLVLSLPSFFGHHPDAGLVWMKVAAACVAVVSLRIIYLIAWRQFGDRSAAIVCALVLACCKTTLTEIQNGMEMNLAALLLMLLFHVLTREEERGRIVYASLLGFLLLLTRFEMPFTLMLLGCGFGYAAFRVRRGTLSAGRLGVIAIAVIVSFLCISLWRHSEFGSWMPNTVYAKRFAPYRDWSTTLRFMSTRVKAMAEPMAVLGPGILIALAVWLRGVQRKKVLWGRFGEIHPAILTLGLGCFLFGAAFGENWGYPGRMVAAMVPFLILSIVGICLGSVEATSSRKMVLALLVFTQSWLWIHRLPGVPWEVSTGKVEPLGIGADRVRMALHQDRLVVMMADVGGSSVCCEHLTVIDSGMLADPTLARTGWPGFAGYFRQVRPELVETHSMWAQDSGIYQQGLLDNYSIVASNGVRFFLRNDLFSKLASEGAGPVLPVSSAPACSAALEKDARISLAKRTCMVLEASGSRNSGIDEIAPRY
jgi:hypothetical protein